MEERVRKSEREGQLKRHDLINALWKWTMNNHWIYFFIFIDLPCVHFNAFYWIKQSKELSCCSLPEHNRYKTFVLFHSFTTAFANKQNIKKQRRDHTIGPHVECIHKKKKQNRSLCSFFFIVVLFNIILFTEYENQIVN